MSEILRTLQVTGKWLGGGWQLLAPGGYQGSSALPERSEQHSSAPAFRLGLDWPDVEAVAESADWWQPNADEKVPGGYKYELIGRDSNGRRLYTAGKEIELYGERMWLVVTIHEAD